MVGNFLIILPCLVHTIVMIREKLVFILSFLSFFYFTCKVGTTLRLPGPSDSPVLTFPSFCKFVF